MAGSDVTLGMASVMARALGISGIDLEEEASLTWDEGSDGARWVMEHRQDYLYGSSASCFSAHAHTRSLPSPRPFSLSLFFSHITHTHR